MARFLSLVCAFFISAPVYAVPERVRGMECCHDNRTGDFHVSGQTVGATGENAHLNSTTPFSHDSISLGLSIRPRFRNLPNGLNSDGPRTPIQHHVNDDSANFETTMWAIVKESKDPSDYDAYLEIFPNGRYADVARETLRKLRERSRSNITLPTNPSERRADREIDPRSVEAALQLTREERSLIQRALNEKNHEAGKADGLFGQKTRGAIWRYQSAMGMKKSGFLTGVQAKELVEHGKRLASSLIQNQSVAKNPTKDLLRTPTSTGEKRDPDRRTSEARQFLAPNFSPGTTFIIRRRAILQNTKLIELRYSGKTENGYDFGEFELSPSFQISRHGKSRQQYNSLIRFPLRFGNSWSYEAEFETPNGRCAVARKMKAKVGDATEPMTVLGKDFRVVKITHRGKQIRTCGGITLDPEEVVREFVYSPQIGMFVSDRITVIRANGTPTVVFSRELVSYSSPTN